MDDAVHRDFGIAVQNAVRLGDCFAELAALLKSQQPMPGDEEHYVSRFSIHPHDEAVVHEWNSRDLAYYIFEREAVEGRLPVWVRLLDEEIKADPSAFIDVDRRTWSNGVFRGAGRGPTYLYGRPLWVKHSDSQALLNRIGLRWTQSDNQETESADASVPGKSEVWSDAVMIARIAECEFTNREKAWREHFGVRQSEHGWNNAAFRHVWSIAKGSTGAIGRPPKTRAS